MSSTAEGRFYEAEFPQLEEIVVVQVKRIVEMGAYVDLLEYNGIEGMMLLSELSKRRIRSVAKLLRVGRTEIVRVLRVDEEKGYIDLSKRRVSPEEAREKEETFAKAKAVHGIMRHVAQNNEINVEDLCMKISWPLYTKFAPSFQECRGAEAYECFRKHVAEESNVWELCDFSQPGEDLTHLETKMKEEIEVHLKRRLIQQKLKVRAKVEVGCEAYEGIDAIKRALAKGQAAGADKEDIELNIKLIAHPLFLLTVECREKEKGMEVIVKAMKEIEDSIQSENGVYVTNQEPKIVNQGQKDDEEEVKSDSGKSGSGSSSEEEEEEGMTFNAEMAGLEGGEGGEGEKKKEKKEKKEKKKDSSSEED